MRISPNRYALAVDDDPSFLMSLRLMLRMCGFAFVTTAEDGINALEYMNKWRYDLVVSDWGMAPIDGIELMRRVRANPATAQVPFILITANLSEIAWRKAIEYGASDFLLKPFGLNDLREACRGSQLAHECEGANVISLQERLGRRRQVL